MAVTAETGPKMSFISTFELVQQTPMIHFQYDEEGATLRASEVKPKLDRFVVDWLYRKGNQVPENWFADKEKKYKGQDGREYGALKYKMKIWTEGDKETARSEHPLDLTHIGSDEAVEKTVFYSEKIRVEIVCFVNELRETIVENIYRFFATNNFGKRQSKGYGSFCVVDDKKDILREVMSIYEEGYVYIDYRKQTVTNEDICNDISILYSLMKSGINFGNDYYKGAIFEFVKSDQAINKFFNGTSINNEKAFYKKKLLKINDITRGQHQGFIEGRKNYYIRAILGFGEGFTYPKSSQTEYVNKYIATIPTAEGVDRFRSAVTFKYINGLLLLLPENCSKILNRDFVFEKHNLSRGKKETIPNPEKEKIATPPKFATCDFLFWFSEQINSELLDTNSRLFKLRDYYIKIDKTTETISTTDRNGSRTTRKITPGNKKHFVNTTVSRLKATGGFKMMGGNINAK